MPATDYQGSSIPFAAIGRSILSIRREQVHAMDGNAGGDPGSGGGGGGRGNDLELEVFQRRVADLFADLAGDGDALSLLWMRKLLDTFLICQEEFRAILFNRNRLSSPLLNLLVADFFERAVKALDVCNAVRDGVEQLRLWRHHLEIVLAAVGAAGTDRPLGEGQLRRSRKAVTDLTLLMLDEKDAAGGSVANHRNRSFGRSGKEPHHRRSGSGGGTGHFRSLSWSVSRSWSAARKLQAIGNNLNAPRGHEVVATNGLAVPVYTMNTVLLFVMWTLVAAIPCQDRGLQIHFSVPRTFQWAGPITSLHERILEESKRKDRKNSCGLLKEIHLVEKCTRHLAELLDPVEFPLSKVKESEVRQGVNELVAICSSLREGLEPLERQVREVFHRIVTSRTEGLDCLSRTHNQE